VLIGTLALSMGVMLITVARGWIKWEVQTKLATEANLQHPGK